MLKYLYHQTIFQEVPKEISLGISITGCQIRCEGCHSKELWKDTGKLLDPKEIDCLLKGHKGVSCVLFMGGERDFPLLNKCMRYVKDMYGLKTAFYTGLELDETLKNIDLKYIDYLKTGPYVESLGGLASESTNQRFYEITDGVLEDKTYLFNLKQKENVQNQNQD